MKYITINRQSKYFPTFLISIAFQNCFCMKNIYYDDNIKNVTYKTKLYKKVNTQNFPDKRMQET